MVALVRGVHGLHGAVRAEVLTDRPEDRFVAGAVLYREGDAQPLTIASAEAVADGPGWRLRFREVPTRDAADHLAQAGAVLVGIDSYNIDDTADGTRPAHSILLAHGIPIVEHLCGLNELPDSGFRFFAVPVKVKKFGTFPVRAFATVTL